MSENTKDKSFIDVFNKVEFSQPERNNLRHVYVNKIEQNKQENQITVTGYAKKIIDENVLESAIDNVKEVIGNTNFLFNFKYENPITFKTDYKNFFDIYVDRLKAKEPLKATILSNTKLEVENVGDSYNMAIHVAKGAKFILTKTDADVRLKKVIFDRFGEDVKITYIEDETILQNDNQSTAKKKVETFEEAKPLNFTEPPIRKAREKSKFKKGSKVSNAKIKEIEVANTIENNLTLNERVTFGGEITYVDVKDLRSGKKLFIFYLSDQTSAITVKMFSSPDDADSISKIIKVGKGVSVEGVITFDDFTNELTVMANAIGEYAIVRDAAIDDELDKRVELHLHTKMSQMDAVIDIEDVFKRAKAFGHSAVAITDHGVVQAFPKAQDYAKEYGIKPLYGVEGYLVNDIDYIVKLCQNRSLNDETYVVFDLETTGLSNRTCKIIEIGAVKVLNGKIIDKFSCMVNPECDIPEKITSLTGISNNDVKDANTIDVELKNFLDFSKDCTLVAHNASFDVYFLNKNCKEIFGYEIDNPFIDTVAFSQLIFNELKTYTLKSLSKHLGISLENHHRAVDDSEAGNKLFLILLEKAEELGIKTTKELNDYALEHLDKRKIRYKHVILFAKNQAGLRNMYELVSKAHIDYYFKRPLLPKSEILKLGDGLIIGSACEAGEVYTLIKDNAPTKILYDVVKFYDYLEVQPLGNNAYMKNKFGFTDDDLIDINKEIIKLSKMFNKPCVATGDVHYLNKADNIHRSILLASEKFSDADDYIPLYFRSTKEMLDEFSYLTYDEAKEIVITNPNKIADMIGEVLPVPKEPYPPIIEGSDDELREITYKRAYKVYGNPLPDIVEKRLERELTSIIKSGFSVLYIAAQKVVWKSVEDGYLVGSRGSVGSSFVATMAEITEVNPLSPHYVCSNCKYSDFDSDIVKEYAGNSGCDMPDMDCPNCGTKLTKDGHDIPFETFLGFDGDKEPDIDLNFSGEYQEQAHKYTDVLFGSEFVFKAGTISTLAEKTADTYVYKYFLERDQDKRKAEIKHLSRYINGIKKSTGQHPGGLMVVPKNNSIYNFTPIQRPANDTKSDVVTTHFEYKALSGRLFKLDLLGHDAPTILKYLYEYTDVDPCSIDLGDKDIMSLFLSPEIMGISLDHIGCQTGSLGLPEFGTNFVRNMLMETRPSTFAELCRISGLSHGTDVWTNNGQDLVNSGTATLKEIIPTRDDIMVYLISKGVENFLAFTIMESVRKGKGLKPEFEKAMEDANVPEWYIESCKKIKYMFPKGHAVAYVMMSVRMGYYKLHYPLAFYSAILSEKYADIDYGTMCRGKDIAFSEYKRLKSLENEISDNEKNKITILEVILEMYERGYEFNMVDIYKSKSTRFYVVDDKIQPPLCTIEGLGENAGKILEESREDGEFETIEDFKNRNKISKTVIDNMRDLGIFKDMPESRQMSLF